MIDRERLRLLNEKIEVLEARIDLTLSDLAALQKMLAEARRERTEGLTPWDRKAWKKEYDARRRAR